MIATIAIGIATMIAVVGISASGKAKLMRDLDRLGTNMLVVTPGQSMFSDKEVKLPKSAMAMVGRIDGVEHVAATGSIGDVNVYRSEHIPKEQTGGIEVAAATAGLKNTLRGSMAAGSWFNAATGSYPSVVLEHSAARRLGICPESSSEPRPPTSTPMSPRCRGRYPPGPWQAAFGAALVIGTIAGLCPAVRASRMSPTLAPHAS